MYMCPRSAHKQNAHRCTFMLLLYYNLAFGRTRSICASSAPDCKHTAKRPRYNPPPTPPHLRSVMFSEMSLFHLSAQHKCRGRTGPRLARSFGSAFWPSGETYHCAKQQNRPIISNLRAHRGTCGETNTHTHRTSVRFHFVLSLSIAIKPLRCRTALLLLLLLLLRDSSSAFHLSAHDRHTHTQTHRNHRHYPIRPPRACARVRVQPRRKTDADSLFALTTHTHTQIHQQVTPVDNNKYHSHRRRRRR